MVWIRGSGYDPFIPPGDPRAGKVRLADEPGLRLPPEDDPPDLWRTRGSSISATGRRPGRRRGEYGHRATTCNRTPPAGGRCAASQPPRGIPPAWSGPPGHRRVLLVASEPMSAAALSPLARDGADTAVLVVAPALQRTRWEYWTADSDDRSRAP